AAANPSWTTNSIGGNTAIGAWSARPGSPGAGDLYFITDGPGGQARYNGSSWDISLRGTPNVPPVPGNFTPITFGTPTTATVGPYPDLVPQPAATYALRVLTITAPSTPYTKEFAFLMPAANYTDLFLLFGAGFRESSSGKMHLLWYDGTSATP